MQIIYQQNNLIFISTNYKILILIQEYTHPGRMTLRVRSFTIIFAVTPKPLKSRLRIRGRPKLCENLLDFYDRFNNRERCDFARSENNGEQTYISILSLKLNSRVIEANLKSRSGYFLQRNGMCSKIRSIASVSLQISKYFWVLFCTLYLMQPHTLNTRLFADRA